MYGVFDLLIRQAEIDAKDHDAHLEWVDGIVQMASRIDGNDVDRAIGALIDLYKHFGDMGGKIRRDAIPNAARQIDEGRIRTTDRTLGIVLQCVRGCG